jgi:hypothetical protein
VTAEYHGNGKSNLRWKLAMLRLWLRHPLWCWRRRKPPEFIRVPPHTFGGNS